MNVIHSNVSLSRAHVDACKESMRQTQIVSARDQEICNLELRICEQQKLNDDVQLQLSNICMQISKVKQHTNYTLVNEADQIRQANQQLQKEIQDNSKEIQRLEQFRITEQQQIDLCGQDQQKATKRNAEVVLQLDKQVQSIDDCQDNGLKTSSDNLTSLQQRVKDLYQEESTLLRDCRHSDHESIQLQQQIDLLEQSLLELEDRKQKLGCHNQEMQAKIVDDKEIIDNNKQELQAYEEYVKTLKDQNSIADTELETLLQTHDNVRDTTLQRKTRFNDLMGSMQSCNRVQHFENTLLSSNSYWRKSTQSFQTEKKQDSKFRSNFAIEQNYKYCNY